MPIENALLRLALRLQRAWQTYVFRDGSIDLRPLSDRLQALHRAVRLLAKSQCHAWLAARALVWEQLDRDWQILQDAVVRTRQAWDRSQTPRLVEWLAELRELDQEFGGLGIDWKKQCVVATTDPIVLQDVALGAFDIRIFWNRLAARCPSEWFDVVARDPNPAARDDQVTHPHVRRQRLCAGDAAPALTKALQAGRLADACCLIRSVLAQYNPSSPHVALDEWGGRTCHDCGCTVPEEDVSYCEACQEDYCPECSTTCAACSTTRCLRCAGRCAVCDEPVCEPCLSPCAHQGRLCCPNCRQPCANCRAEVARDELTPETALCRTCRPPPSAAPPEAATAGTMPAPTPDLLPLEHFHATPIDPVPVTPP